VTSGSTTTTTVYVGGVEEVATSGATTTTTAYYYAGVKRIGLSVNGAVSYLASDGLGSADVTLSAAGSATASVLYAPYGAARYSSETMPTTYGFTGQRADTVSGLDYYGARYYDPLSGQFITADTAIPGTGVDLWAMSRYAYVEGNPIIRTDPTGHIHECECGDGGGPSIPAPAPLPGPPDRCGACNEGARSHSSGRGTLSHPGSGGISTDHGEESSSGPEVKVISATCIQVNGANVGSCGPTHGNMNTNPAYQQCFRLGMCEWWDPEGLSLGSYLATNGGGDPDSAASQADERGVQGAGRSESRASRDEYLFRFGTEPESADALAQDAARGPRNGFPHGVSAFSRSTRSDAVKAPRSEVEKYFVVVKTGTNKYRYTVIMPSEITQDVADRFNSLFGRGS
jgi:RHS repeat-associated protein